MGYILLVEDNRNFLETLKAMLESHGHECDTAMTLGSAWERLQANRYELVFLDLTLPDGNGLDLIPRITGLAQSPAVLVLTGRKDDESVDMALNAGALDYLLKPVDTDQLEPLVSRTIESHRARQRASRDMEYDRCRIVGDSPQIRNVLEQLAVAAKSDGHVLITGETGTGKELFARAVHQNSKRRDGPFIVVDCTNLPETLAESLLFGHEKGSFTGAQESREGLFKQADGGTIVLDEIGDLGFNLQKRLLRVLQEKKFRPLSSKKEISSDFRLIAATNSDLDEMMRQGEFRSDLYYRIKMMHLRLPALKDREGDIALLAEFYLERTCKSLGVPLKRMCADFIEALRRYTWPGNVRELVNALYNAVSKAVYEDSLAPHHLPLEIRSFLAKQRLEEEDGEAEPADQEVSFQENGSLLKLKEIRKRTIESMEKAYLDRLSDQCGRSISRACTISGLSRARLYELLQKHNINMRDGSQA